MIDIFCPDDQGPILAENNALTITDDGHWTIEGAKIFGERFKNANNTAAKLLVKSDQNL